MAGSGTYTVTGDTVKLTAATSAPTPVQCSSVTLGGNQYCVINASTTQGCFLSFAAETVGVNFGGCILSEANNPDSQQALRYDQFIAPLIKAVQELCEKVNALTEQVNRKKGT